MKSEQNRFFFDPESGCLLKAGETFMPYMNPYNYYIKSGAEASPDRLIAIFQNELHGLFNSYLNCHDFIGRREYLYPLINTTNSDYYCKAIGRLKTICKELSKSYDEDFKEINSSIELSDIKTIISTCYTMLERFIPTTEIVASSVSIKALGQAVPSDYEEYDEEFLWPVVKLIEHSVKTLSNYVLNVYIHGSLSTLDYEKGFSDLDTLVIVTEKTSQDPALLQELRFKLYPLTKYMYHIDPLQHHGFFIISKIDMAFYPKTFFPTELFQYAKSMLENKNLNFRLRGYKLEALHSLWGICQHFRACCNHTNNKEMDLYGFKEIISYLLILPAFYIQAVSKPIYKKYSFERIRQIYSGDTGIIDIASKIRGKWLYNPPNYFKTISCLLNPALVRKMSSIHLKLNSEERVLLKNIGQFLEEALILAEDMLKQSCEESNYEDSLIKSYRV